MSDLALNLLTVAQVAEKLSVHPNTVRNLIKRKDLHAYRIGREYRISLGDLTQYFLSTSTIRQTGDPEPVAVTLPLVGKGGADAD